MLKLANSAYYTGITNDLYQRIKKHRSGKGSKYVRAHLPFIVVYTERAKDKSSALKRESAIKRLTHSEKEILVYGGLL